MRLGKVFQPCEDHSAPQCPVWVKDKDHQNATCNENFKKVLSSMCKCPNTDTDMPKASRRMPRIGDRQLGCSSTKAQASSMTLDELMIDHTTCNRVLCFLSATISMLPLQTIRNSSQPEMKASRH